MKANQFNEFECSNENYSTKMSDYYFKHENTMLYVSSKKSNELLFIILDVINIQEVLTLFKCLINNVDLIFRQYYTISELNQIFKNDMKSTFHIVNNEISIELSYEIQTETQKIDVKNESRTKYTRLEKNQKNQIFFNLNNCIPNSQNEVICTNFFSSSYLTNLNISKCLTFN